MSVDAIMRGGTTLEFDLDSKPGTLRMPHTVRRTDGEEVRLRVKFKAAASATSLVLEEIDAGRVEGTIPSGLVLTIAGTAYTTQAAATFSGNAATVTISPGLDAAAVPGTTVSLASHAIYGDATAAATAGYRYREEAVTIDQVRTGIEVGARTLAIETPAGVTLPAPKMSLFDSTAAPVAVLRRQLDKWPESQLWEAA